MPTIITSPSNLKIKKVISLRESKERRKSGLTIVEGVREFSRAQEAGLSFSEIFLCPSLLKKYADADWIRNLKEFPVFELNQELFAKISFGDRLEGILAVLKVRSSPIEEMKFKEASLWVEIESVEKPGNLGAILRTADAVGVCGVFVSDPATDIYNPNVIRASLGTVFSLPLMLAKKESGLEFFRQHKIKVCSLTPDAEKIYTDADLSGNCAIVVGSEQKGLSDFWKKNSDEKLRIPMLGRADSLNVSTSAAIVLYEAVRQRSTKAKK